MKPLPYLLIIALDAALLFHFGCIWQYGVFTIQEPNPIILTVETILLACILFYGLWNFWKLIK